MNEPKILVVDDETKLADVYKHWLGDEYETHVAYSGSEALDIVDETFNIVFLDRRMPDMSGDQVLDEIRDDGLDCWVVMVTGKDPGKEIIDMEFDAYISKPINEDEILAIVNTIQDRAEYNSKIREYTAVKNKISVLRESIEDDRRDKSEFYQELKKTADSLEGEIEETVERIDGVIVEPDDISSLR